MRKLLWGTGLAVLGLGWAACLAKAAEESDPSGAARWFAIVCADQAFWTKVIAWVGGTSFSASLLANARFLPKPVLGLLEFVGANWYVWFKGAAGNAAKVSALLAIVALAACAGLAPVAGGVAGGAAAVTAVANATSEVAKGVAAVEGNGLAIFKAGCGAASIGHGYFAALAPALVVAGKLAPADLDAEKAAFAGWQAMCDPANPPADLEEAGIRLTAWAGGLYITIATAGK